MSERDRERERYLKICMFKSSFLVFTVMHMLECIQIHGNMSWSTNRACMGQCLATLQPCSRSGTGRRSQKKKKKKKKQEQARTRGGWARSMQPFRFHNWKKQRASRPPRLWPSPPRPGREHLRQGTRLRYRGAACLFRDTVHAWETHLFVFACAVN